LGFSRLLLDDPHLDREQRPALEAISRSAGHLMLLINNMLDLSKIEFGRVELQPSLFELPDLVNALGYEFMIGAQAKGLGFRLEGLKDLPSVVIADETKLRQILLNLVGNAIKFTRQGEVSLKIWYQAHQYLEALPAHLGAASCGNLWIEVQDTGSGISELDLQKLFSPFEQSASGQIFAEGVGLGLAIAKAYVDLMGGQIQVESQVGRGTRFALWVAISEGPARHVLEDQALSLAAPSSPDAPPPPRILILDAMSDSLQLAGRWLMSLGCEVRIVLRPEDLDQVIPTWQPQVLCLDVYRTPWDSRALVQKWRPAFGGLLWAMDVLEAEPQPSWLHLGCDALLSKPLSRRYLRQLLHDQLGMEPQKDPQLMTQTLSIFNLSYDWNKVDVKIRAELAEAVRLCERRRVQVLLNEIRPVEPALAEILDEYSKNFRFDLIEHLLEKPGSGEATHG
jgi:CheY-like chemotaxis protein